MDVLQSPEGSTEQEKSIAAIYALFLELSGRYPWIGNKNFSNLPSLNPQDLADIAANLTAISNLAEEDKLDTAIVSSLASVTEFTPQNTNLNEIFKNKLISALEVIMFFFNIKPSSTVRSLRNLSLDKLAGLANALCSITGCVDIISVVAKLANLISEDELLMFH